jgi:auxin efflux carrier family protein
MEDRENSTQMMQLPTTPISATIGPSSSSSYGHRVSFYGSNDKDVTPVSEDFMRSRLYSPAATETAVSRPSSPMGPSKDFARPNPGATPKASSSNPISSSETGASLPTATLSTRSRAQRARTTAVSFLRSLLSPVTISVCTAFACSLIPPLKALFIANVPDTHIPNAPDGEPPLAFILDTASFIGAASVPLSLVCLGSALARLKVPRRIRDLPLGAIGALAVGKTILMPILGVAICQGLVHAGLINAEDKVLRFVCM